MDTSVEAGVAKNRLNEQYWTGGLPKVVWYDLGPDIKTAADLPSEVQRDIPTSFYESHVRPNARFAVLPSQVMSGRFLLRVEGVTGYPYVFTAGGKHFPLYQAGGDSEATEKVVQLGNGNVAINFFLALDR